MDQGPPDKLQVIQVAQENGSVGPENDPNEDYRSWPVIREVAHMRLPWRLVGDVIRYGEIRVYLK
jgi:hypothetical protein